MNAQMIGKSVQVRTSEMANKTKTPQAANSDQKNPNRGTPGTNKNWDKAQGNRGNRGKQLNPNQGDRKGQ